MRTLAAGILHPLHILTTTFAGALPVCRGFKTFSVLIVVVFHYARVSDIMHAIKEEIKKSRGITHVYIAVAEKFLDPRILPKMQEELSKVEVKQFRK